MKRASKILFGIFIAAIIIVAIVPSIAYVMLSTDWAQETLRKSFEEMAEKLIGTDVNIEKVSFQPFNRIEINGISVKDDYSTEALSIDNINARFELFDFIFRGNVIVDYAVIDGTKINIYKKDIDSKINLTGIINRLKPKEKKEKETSFKFKLNDVEILNGEMSYDVLSEPIDSNRFDKNHIHLSHINLLARVPIISSSEYGLEVRNLNFIEEKGFVVDNLSFLLRISDSNLTVGDFQLNLPMSELKFGDIEIDLKGIGSLPEVGTSIPINLDVIAGSWITLSDFGPLFPVLAPLNHRLNLSLGIEGKIDDFSVNSLSVTERMGQLKLIFSGKVIGLPNIKETVFEDTHIDFSLSPRPLKDITSIFNSELPKKTNEIISNIGNVRASIDVSGKLEDADVSANIESAAGKVNVDGNIGYDGDVFKFNAKSSLNDFDIGCFIDNENFGRTSVNVDTKGAIKSKTFQGVGKVNIDYIDYKGYSYRNIEASFSRTNLTDSFSLVSNDVNAKINVSAFSELNKEDNFERVKLYGRIASFNPDSLNLYKAFPGNCLAGNIMADFNYRNVDEMSGKLSLTDFTFLDKAGHGVKLNKFNLDSNNLDNGLGILTIESDMLNGNIEGRYALSTVWQNIREIVCSTFPPLTSVLNSNFIQTKGLKNDFSYDFTIDNAYHLCKFFNMPVIITDPVRITGDLSAERQEFQLEVDAPWLIQGDKLIENTSVQVDISSSRQFGSVYATTLMPTKKGPMNVVLTIAGKNRDFTTDVDWSIEREIPINGRFEVITSFVEGLKERQGILIKFAPGEINFGEDVWKLSSSEILWQDKSLGVDNFSMESGEQKVIINGKVSDSPEEKLSVKLSNVNLVSIFETLDIDKALICGKATANINISQLFSNEPQIRSSEFRVKDIGYNYCSFGDGDIDMWFDNVTESFVFDAVIHGYDNEISKINGSLSPFAEALDLDIDAKHVSVGFLQPFMSAFCSGLKGYVSGEARLFGTFEYIDLDADLYVEDFKMKVDFTDVWYSTTDSVKVVSGDKVHPGEIRLENVKIFDEYGHSAKLNGIVNHWFFKEPSFDFKVSEADNLLCYDVKREQSPRWHGKIFGNGYATIKGEPGIVEIGANMTTQHGSSFTFELTDLEEAREFSFIKFRDVTPRMEIEDSLLEIRKEPVAEKIVKGLRQDEDVETPTAFNIDITVDITPATKVTIVMDPIGGDKIDCTGNGYMNMKYYSVDDELKLIGEYKLDSGSYDFTLQDIISRNFTIMQGSQITFNGNPFNAMLDINAYYPVKNANLTDLDETFAADKELSRTRVTVWAMMNVTGSIRQPDISFDLKIPYLNLSDDIERKVHSIVSTEEMMNMQIIYLLTLERFYTPDYMSATKGNELFSVASSTISSKISSMLGKLSDKWTIAPNLRSDRGDFSDLEVDVTLQSNLLNNRLIINGNLGYRDKSLNTNQFIGDFDAEYLLNRTGSFRLKGYSRYNDQNYYLRSAKTTQGVGFVLKRDFDSFLPFRRAKEEKKDTINSLPRDSIQSLDNKSAE